MTSKWLRPANDKDFEKSALGEWFHNSADWGSLWIRVLCGGVLKSGGGAGKEVNGFDHLLISSLVQCRDSGIRGHWNWPGAFVPQVLEIFSSGFNKRAASTWDWSMGACVRLLQHWRSNGTVYQYNDNDKWINDIYNLFDHLGQWIKIYYFIFIRSLRDLLEIVSDADCVWGV